MRLNIERHLSEYQQKPWMDKLNTIKKKWPDRSGEKNPNRKITELGVWAIRDHGEKHSIKQWSIILGISERQIYKIKANKAWKE